MKRLILAAAALLLAVASTGGSGSAAPTNTVTHRATFEGVQPPARYFRLIEGISEFAPGQAGRLNSVAAPRYFSVIQGEVTVTIGSKTEVYTAGQTWSVPSGIYFEPRNDANTTARVFFTVLSLPGVTPQPVPGSTVPANPSRILWTASTSVYVPANRIDLLQIIQEAEPGFKTSTHVMNHPHVYIVMEGENTLRYLDGQVETSAAGEQNVMGMGRPGTMENSGDANSQLAFSWLITPGTPPTSPVTGQPAAAAGAISPPSTGDAGLVGGETTNLPGLGILVGSAVLSLAIVAGRRGVQRG